MKLKPQAMDFLCFEIGVHLGVDKEKVRPIGDQFRFAKVL